jgi:hypothetical protein
VTLHQSDNAPNAGGLLVAPMKGFEEVLAHPTGFKNVANGRDQIAYWQMIPPEGYKALGICFTANFKKMPQKENYWCVKDNNAYLESAASAHAWSDKGTGFGDDMNLIEPAQNSTAQTASDELLLTPPTFLWAPSPGDAYVLRLKKCKIDFPETTPEMPETYRKRPQDKQTLVAGFKGLQVLPWVAVPNLPGSAAKPFFFLSIREFWSCTGTKNTGSFPEEWTAEYKVGTEKKQSSELQQKTGITLSAEAGGEAYGLSVKLSATFTEEMGTTTSTASSKQTEEDKKRTYQVPANTILANWQRIRTIDVYNTSADRVSRAEFGYDDAFKTEFPIPPKQASN